MPDSLLNVRIGGIEFEGDPRSDHGYVIEPGGLSGWDESTPGRQSGGERPNAHGAFNVPLFRTARTITVTGHILARSGFEFEHMKERLTGLGADGTRPRLQVEKLLGTMWTDVRVMSARTVDMDARTGSFIVQMVANDPRRFRELNEFGPGTSLSVFHRGNTVGIPVIRVTGTMPSGYTINGPNGRSYVVTQALTSGQEHEIRMRTGWLYRNGAVQRTAVSRMETWGIPAGQPVAMSLTPASGSGQMTVSQYDTFM